VPRGDQTLGFLWCGAYEVSGLSSRQPTGRGLDRVYDGRSLLNRTMCDRSQQVEADPARGYQSSEQKAA
jgi:hypothetical protein